MRPFVRFVAVLRRELFGTHGRGGVDRVERESCGLGNFIGDAVKGRRRGRPIWERDVALGIRFHRAIDDTSDRHPASKEARALIRPWCGKWSGVVWDVLTDHVLARQFPKLAPDCGPLESFVQGQESALGLRVEAMPVRSQHFFAAMVHHCWLVGYRDPVVVADVLEAMSLRRSAAGPVARGMEAFQAHEGRLTLLGEALLYDMELWGKAMNLVSLLPQPGG